VVRKPATNHTGLVTKAESGFTFIELVIVIVILGVFVTVATRTIDTSIDASRQAEAEDELNRLAIATVGNDKLASGGMRTDFGYVGDVGALPPSLDYLASNPGGYATWNGPYIRDNFVENSADYKTDPWGVVYSYSGGVTIQSTGSGSTITKQFANSTSDILSTPLRGVILDRDGAPPGTDASNVTVTVTYPNGAGGTTTSTINPNSSGSFSFTGLPIGNHSITAVYSTANDTALAYSSSLPRVGGYAGVMRLGGAYWTDTTGGGGSGGPGGVIQYVGGSSELESNGKEVKFKIRNTGSTNISLTWMIITWDVPSGVYAEEVKLDGTKYFNNSCNRLTSGDTVFISPSYSLPPAQDKKIQIKKYKNALCGGSDASIPPNTSYTVEFSNGDTITFTVM